jgi:MFS family permease
MKTTLLQSLLLLVGGSCLALSVQEYFLGTRIPVSAVAGALVFLLAAVVLALKVKPAKEAGQMPKPADWVRRLLFGVVASGGLALVVLLPLVIVVRTEGHLIAGWFNEPVPWGILLGLLNVWAIFTGLFFLGYIVYMVLNLKDYNVKQST